MPESSASAGEPAEVASDAPTTFSWATTSPQFVTAGARVSIVTNASGSVTITNSVRQYLTNEIWARLEEFSKGSEGRFTIQTVDDDTIPFNETRLEKDKLWSPDPQVRADLFEGLKDKQAARFIASTQHAWGTLLLTGISDIYYQILGETEQAGVHQLARAVLHEAAQVNTDWPKSVSRNTVKGFTLFTATGRAKFSNSFRAVYGRAGDGYARLIIASLQEVAHRLPASQLALGITEESLSAQAICVNEIGTTETEEKLSEAAFEGAQRRGELVKFDKKANGEPRYLEGKVKVMKRVPRKMHFTENDNRMRKDEGGIIRSWMESHRYTLSTAEVALVNETFLTPEKKTELVKKINEATSKILAQEHRIMAIFDSRKKEIIEDARYKDVAGKDRTIAFDLVRKEKLLTWTEDIKQECAAPVFKDRTAFMTFLCQ